MGTVYCNAICRVLILYSTGIFEFAMALLANALHSLIHVYSMVLIKCEVYFTIYVHLLADKYLEHYCIVLPLFLSISVMLHVVSVSKLFYTCCQYPQPFKCVDKYEG